MWNWLKSFFKLTLTRMAICVFVVLRVLNTLEPPVSGSIPVRDYVPILSWSKIARIVGLLIIIGMFLSGAPMEWEGVIALLTYVGGESSYRFRQWNSDIPGTNVVDTPDEQQDDK